LTELEERERLRLAKKVCTSNILIKSLERHFIICFQIFNNLSKSENFVELWICTSILRSLCSEVLFSLYESNERILFAKEVMILQERCSDYLDLERALFAHTLRHWIC
jgi:hypothetical protein